VEAKHTLQAHHFARVVFSDDEDKSINRYNWIAAPKESLISLLHTNEYVNFAMKACDIITNCPSQGHYC
jgi:hypothetical protein